jgi:hypothetical protein
MEQMAGRHVIGPVARSSGPCISKHSPDLVHSRSLGPVGFARLRLGGAASSCRFLAVWLRVVGMVGERGY